MDQTTQLTVLIGAAVIGLLAVLMILRRDRHEVEDAARESPFAASSEQRRDEALSLLRDRQPRDRSDLLELWEALAGVGAGSGARNAPRSYRQLNAQDSSQIGRPEHPVLSLSAESPSRPRSQRFVRW